MPGLGAEQITAVNILGLAGGAQSVRLKSWDEPLRYPVVAESKVRENIQQLLEICRLRIWTRLISGLRSP